MGGVKIAWVRWEDNCKPKCLGGIGVLDLRLVNQSLLRKWLWRVILDRPSLWSDILIDMYGPKVPLCHLGGCSINLYRVSSKRNDASFWELSWTLLQIGL